MSVQEVEIDSLGELIDRVTPGEVDRATGRRRDSGVYRGSAGECDRVLWRLDWKAVHRRFGLPEPALQIADLGQLAAKFGAQRRRQTEEFTPWTLFAARDEAAPFACMLEPPSLDARIVAQSAAFTLCSSTSEPFDRFLEEHGLAGAVTRFVIPGHAVARLRDQLDLASVDERRLFPDLDGVTARMRRYYP